MVYKKFIGKMANPGALCFMSLLEFEDLVTKTEVFNPNFGQKQLSTIFYVSIMTQVDEIEKDRHINMIFVEFVEAVIRVADKLEIPHVIDDGLDPRLDEIPASSKANYAARSTPEKVEAFVLLLMKTHLTTK